MNIKERAIIDAYNSGRSLGSIAQEFHTYRTSVKRILNKYGIELRHDAYTKGSLHVGDGEKLIEWAKAQGRPVTKAELAAVIGRKRLSPSYFLKYPELGQYIEIYEQQDLREYTQKLYNWLKENDIPYKPNDRTRLKLSIDALLLKEYTNIAIHIAEKPKYISKKAYTEGLRERTERAGKAKVNLIFLTKEDLDNPERLAKLRKALDVLKYKE